MGDLTIVRFVTLGRDPSITEKQAMIYLHWGGDATYMAEVFEEFFLAVERQCGRDTRFHDNEYLAAKFVVWMAGESISGDETTPLNFLSVGVKTGTVKSGLEEGAWTYAVVCNPRGNNLRPKVMVDEALTDVDREVAFHQMTEISEYLEAKRKNEEEENDA